MFIVCQAKYFHFLKFNIIHDLCYNVTADFIPGGLPAGLDEGCKTNFGRIA
jgi:hypothetical protein